jgi:hypothetical protein
MADKVEELKRRDTRDLPYAETLDVYFEFVEPVHKYVVPLYDRLEMIKKEFVYPPHKDYF